MSEEFDLPPKSEEIKEKEYPLIGKWKLWKHSLDESDWSIESYKSLPEFTTLNEFWKIYNNHSGITNGLYFNASKLNFKITFTSDNTKLNTFKYPFNI